MKFHVIQQQTQNGAQSPVRVVEQKTGREIGRINRYLDREYVRRLADITLRIYSTLTTCGASFADGNASTTLATSR